MWETLQSDPEKFGAAIILCGFAAAWVATVWIKAWHKNEAGKRDAEIKLEMLTRGMSADDIERVLAAKTSADLNETAVQKKQ